MPIVYDFSLRVWKNRHSGQLLREVVKKSIWQNWEICGTFRFLKEFFMKKIFATVFLFSSLGVLADEATAPPSILSKCPPPGSLLENVAFEFSGGWLYLQPNGSNLYYAAEAFPYDTSISNPPASPNWQIFEFDPGYHSGFEVGAKFLFLQNDINIQLNWERLFAKESSSMDVTPLSYGTGNMVGPIYDIGPNSAAYKAAQGKAFFKFDEVNLLAQKSICFTKDLLLDLDLGLSFSLIRQKITSYYENSGESTTRTISSKSSYWGIGPQMGLHLDYNLFCGVSLVGSSSWSIYSGQIKNHVTYDSVSPTSAEAGIPQPNAQQNTIPTRTQLIPGFDERLGLVYCHSFPNWNISIGAGYLFQIYLNAVQSMDMLTQAVPNFDPGLIPDQATFAVTFNRTLSNFMLSGPYVSCSVGF